MAVYVQRADKNIIYAITKSNAVLDYSGDEAGEIKEVKTGLQPWEIVRIAATAVIGVISLLLLVFAVGGMIRHKKSQNPYKG